MIMFLSIIALPSIILCGLALKDSQGARFAELIALGADRQREAGDEKMEFGGEQAAAGCEAGFYPIEYNALRCEFCC